MSDYKPARSRISVSAGESVRILREPHELIQSELSEISGIPQSTISAIENERINLGAVRAKVFACALRCHPAVLVFQVGISMKNPPHNQKLQQIFDCSLPTLPRRSVAIKLT